MRLEQFDEPDTAMHSLQRRFLLVHRDLAPLAISLDRLNGLDEQRDLIMESEEDLGRLLCAPQSSSRVGPPP